MKETKMEILDNSNLKCICGVSKKYHTPDLIGMHYENCFARLGKTTDCNCAHKFKLDNLSYIEALANEKGLI